MNETDGNENSLILPCQSEILMKLNPTFYNSTKKLNNFILTEYCHVNDPCVKLKKIKLKFPHKQSLYFVEKSSFKLYCPHLRNSTEIYHFEWIINDGRLLNSSFNALGFGIKDAHYGVDINGTLYATSVELKDSGKYACFINEEAVKIYSIVITPKSILSSNGIYFQSNIYFLMI